MRSVVVVLPASMCAMIPMLRVFSSEYLRGMVQRAGCGGTGKENGPLGPARTTRSGAESSCYVPEVSILRRDVPGRARSSAHGDGREVIVAEGLPAPGRSRARESAAMWRFCPRFESAVSAGRRRRARPGQTPVRPPCAATARPAAAVDGCRPSPLPAVVREGLVGLRHAEDVVLALERAALLVRGVHELVGEPLGHRLLAAVARELDQPADGERAGAAR